MQVESNILNRLNKLIDETIIEINDFSECQNETMRQLMIPQFKRILESLINEREIFEERCQIDHQKY